MELDGDGGVVVEADFDALGHGFPAQEMDQAVGGGAHSHTLDAVAVGGRGASDVGEDVRADGDGAPLCFQSHMEPPYRTEYTYFGFYILYSILALNTREKVIRGDCNLHRNRVHYEYL